MAYTPPVDRLQYNPVSFQGVHLGIPHSRLAQVFYCVSCCDSHLGVTLGGIKAQRTAALPSIATDTTRRKDPILNRKCCLFFHWMAQMGVIREALVERVQPDVAAAVKEAIDVRNRVSCVEILPMALSCVLAPQDGFLLDAFDLLMAVDRCIAWFCFYCF